MKFSALFVIFFTGNGVLFDFDLFWLVSAFIIGYSFLQSRLISSNRIIFALIIIIMFIANPIKITESDYFLSLINLSLALLFWDVIESLAEKIDNTDCILALFLIVGLVPILYSLSLNSSRAWFVFGPNVLYRVISFSVVFVFLYQYRNPVSSLLLKSISLFLGFFNVLMTGSRGGVLAIMTPLYVLITTYKANVKIIFYIILFTILVGILLAPYFYEELTSNRVFRIDISEESLTVRLFNYYYLPEFLSSSFSNFMFGVSDIKAHLPVMPHNIILETFYMHGFILGILVCFGFIAFIIRCFNFKLSNLEIILLPVLVGSMFSGTYWDNFLVVALFCNSLYRLKQ